MNAGSTFGTAILRGLYNAIGAGGVSLLMTYQVAGSWHDALIVGAITALGALGFRGVVEGSADANRDAKGQVKSGDVGQLNR